MAVNNNQSYETIKIWKEEHINVNVYDTLSLNYFHDTVILMVFELAVIRLNKGNPPCDFCWFITGSGGRKEQGLISDQDHGIIFEGSDRNSEEYFLALGNEISYGLNIVGYPFCNGNVMSSNPLWCKSLEHWVQQIEKWIIEKSLESIRNLQIFFDARCLVGEDDYVKVLKSTIFSYQNKNPKLIHRLINNIMHIKNAIGPLGQFILEDHGIHQGSFNMKQTTYIPYVNAIRILAIKEGLYETSTNDRLDVLIKKQNDNVEILKTSKRNFNRILQFRLSVAKANSYKDTHYILLENLSKEEKKELKQIIRDGRKLHQYVTKLIEKG